MSKLRVVAELFVFPEDPQDLPGGGGPFGRMPGDGDERAG